MRGLRLRLGGVQTHDAAPAQDGNDPRDPELGRLLHDEIHAVAARDALGERDGERRLAVDGACLAHRRPSPAVPRTLSTVAANSRPSPVNSTSASPLRTRRPSRGAAPPLAGAREWLPGSRRRRRTRASSSLDGFLCSEGAAPGGVHKRRIVAYATARHGRYDPASGVLRGRASVSPNSIRGPPGVAADLIVVHGISLPPGEFGGPWIDRLFTNSLPAEAHPYFAEVAGLRVSSHLASAATARSPNM